MNLPVQQHFKEACNAIEKPHQLMAAMKNQQLVHSVMRRMSCGDNESMIKVNECMADDGAQSTTEKDKEKAIRSALKQSSALFKQHLAQMEALQSYYEDIADTAEKMAQEIRDSEEYKAAQADVEALESAMETGDPEKMRAALEKQGVEIKKDATAQEIITMMQDSSLEAKIHLQEYNDLLETLDETAKEARRRAAEIGNDRENMIELTDKGVPMEAIMEKYEDELASVDTALKAIQDNQPVNDGEFLEGYSAADRVSDLEGKPENQQTWVMPVNG